MTIGLYHPVRHTQNEHGYFTTDSPKNLVVDRSGSYLNSKEFIPSDGVK